MISIINYGLGNIKAIASAYNFLGIEYHIANKPGDLDKSSHIILPGVGSFDDAMSKIKKTGFKEKLDLLVMNENINILGICVGFQVMCKSSNEGVQKGFGWLDTQAKMIDINKNFKVPHMGWSKIEIFKKCPILHDVNQKEFYFLHSYNVDDNNDEYKSATINYEIPLTAAVSYKNIFGVQFHPEKSHDQGLQVLKNFSGLKKYD